MDIDIDLPTSFDPLDIFDAVRASMIKDDALVKHPVGIYLQDINPDPISGFSCIPYKEAEQLGYFKIDFLHLSVLDTLPPITKTEMRHLLNVEPDWNMLQNEIVVSRLFQIHKHYDTLLEIQPKSVQELADTIALIRPAKAPLRRKYLQNKIATRKELYKLPLPTGCFKKGHAIAYALTIVLQLHFIKAGML